MVQRKEDGQDEYTYDIVRVEDLEIYRVFENKEEELYYRCIFSSPSRKECQEWLKKHKEDLKKRKREKEQNDNNDRKRSISKI